MLSNSDEAVLFRQLRLRLIRNIVQQTLSAARLRLTLLATLTTIMWLGLFILFGGGFRFLSLTIDDPATHDETVRAVYNVFFASLTVMLTLSTAIILFGGLFRSAEVRFLLTTPLSPERIFLHKFQEALLFASWGFLILGSPMLIAYGAIHDAGWHYFAMLVPFMVAFSFIPGSIGAIVCLLIMRYVPLERLRFATVILIFVLLALARFGWTMLAERREDMLTPGWFQEIFARLRYTENRLLPNWWLSSGLLEAARGNWHGELGRMALRESMLFFSLLVSNALFFHQAAIWTAARVFRRTYHAAQTGRTARRHQGVYWMDRWLQRATFFLRPETRLLFVKDLRLFRRDPAQWSQFLIFFGLLTLYFFNTRWLRYDTNYTGYVHVLSFLNLAVVGLILCTFTTRFIFPMISLEGRRFWILGLMPIPRATILWGKFLFAALGSLIPCTLLVLLSDLMLRVSPLVIGVHFLACVLLCSGLSGIAVGLGARLPSLREESPARIAAGFGGTLNLVLSAVYILMIVALVALPCHIALAAADLTAFSPWFSQQYLPWWLALCLGSSLILTIVATAVPLRMGIKAFREMEF